MAFFYILNNLKAMKIFFNYHMRNLGMGELGIIEHRRYNPSCNEIKLMLPIFLLK